MKTILKQLLLLAGLLTAQKTSAQNPGVIWEREISGEIPYQVGEVKSTSDHGIIIVGTAGVDAEQNDIFLSKYSEEGDLLWTKYYGGNDDEAGFSVVEVSSGGFIICGKTNSYGNGNNDLFIVRTDDAGDEYWHETFGTGGSEGGTRIREVSDGYLVGGFQEENGLVGMVMVKFDFYGEILWSESYSQLGEMGFEAGTAFEPAGSGFIVTGVFLNSNSMYESQVVKLHSIGNIEWVYVISSGGDNFMYDVKPTEDGYLICGKSKNDPEDHFNSRIVKLDNGGNVVWDKLYNFRDESTINQLVLRDDGEFEGIGTITDTSDHMFVCAFTSWGDTLSLEEMEFRGPAIGKGIGVSDDRTVIYLSGDAVDPNTNFSIGLVVGYILPCPVWFPRALQINNMWCPGGNQCYPSLTKILTDATGQSADSLLDYLQFNKIRNLLLGDLNVVLFEDVLVNRNSNVNGEDLRDSLASLIARIRSLPDITDITVILRDMDDEDIADTSNNMEMIRLTSAFNKNYGFTSRINELSLDYEFWRDRYGDPSNSNSADYPFLQQGWQHYREIANRMQQVKSDTTNRISVISTILGRMDRNIDGNMATGLDGEDENLIVDFADSTFNRVFLFFYIPDNTGQGGPFSVQTPTRFMTGWGDFAQLAERIYWFGANSTQSNIWPMYSAEDSLSPNDDNIYLGRWLQGTGTWTNQHYLTECQNLFREQVPVYITDEILPIYPNWNHSLNISGDAFFKYGLNDLDALRTQDRFPNFYTRPACYQYRIANSGNSSFENHGLKTDTNKHSCVIIKSDEDFNQFRSDQEKQSFLFSADRKSFHLQEVEFKTLTSGLYFIKSGTIHRRIVIVK